MENNISNSQSTTQSKGIVGDPQFERPPTNIDVQGISKPFPPIPGPSGSTLGKINDCPVKYIRFEIDLPKKDN